MVLNLFYMMLHFLNNKFPNKSGIKQMHVDCYNYRLNNHRSFIIYSLIQSPIHIHLYFNIHDMLFHHFLRKYIWLILLLLVFVYTIFRLMIWYVRANIKHMYYQYYIYHIYRLNYHLLLFDYHL